MESFRQTKTLKVIESLNLTLPNPPLSHVSNHHIYTSDAEQMSQLQFAGRGPPVSAALMFSAIRKALAKTMLLVNTEPPAGMSGTWIWKSDHNVKLRNLHKIKHNISIIWFSLSCRFPSISLQILQAVIKSTEYQNFHRQEGNILQLHLYVKILLCLQPEAV